MFKEISKKCKKLFFTGTLSFLLLLILSSSNISRVKAGRFYFGSPATNNTATTCEGSIDLIIDTEGQNSNAADIIITYDPTKITVKDSDAGTSGTQITAGIAYPTYYGNTTNTSTGIIRLTGVNTSGNLNGSQIYASIDYAVTNNTSASLNISFTGSGSTLDSNIGSSSTNNDLLTSVGNYTFTADDCFFDTTPPVEEPEEPVEPEEPEEPTPPSLPIDDDDEPEVPEEPEEEDEDECNGLLDCTIGKGGISQVTKNLPLPNFLKTALNDFTFSGLISLAFLAFFAINLINLFSIIRTPFLFYLFIIGLLKRKNRPWGLILDSKDKKPIAFATIRVYRKDTKKLIETKVSDLDGKYGFILSPGLYEIEVKHPYYKDITVDKQITREGETIDADIYLVANSENGLYNNKSTVKSNNFRLSTANKVLFVVGFTFSVLAVLLSPVLINYVILAAYIIQISFLIFIAINRPSSWGQVTLIQEDRPVGLAQIKIYDPNNWSLIDTQMTNKNGKFGFFLDAGQYAIQVDAQGKILSDKQNPGIKVINNNGNKTVEFEYKKGAQNKVELFVE